MKSAFRKLTLVALESDHNRLISSLQELGVVHIDKKEALENKEIEEAIHTRNTLSGIGKLLKSLKPPKAHGYSRGMLLPDITNNILSAEKEIEHHEQEIEATLKDYEKLQSWGNYSYELFVPLIDRGYHVYMCVAANKVFQNLDLSGLYIQVVNKSLKDVFFIVITKNSDLQLPIEYIPIPQQSPEELQKEVRLRRSKIKLLTKKIANYRPYLNRVQEEYLSYRDKIDLLEAKYSTEVITDGKMISINGWFPKDKEEMVRTFLENQRVAYLIREPNPEEAPPTLLHNKAYSKLFEPITEIFDLPNYHEADLTPFIAVFYPILFAYCLGDAGYGFVLAIAMAIGYFTFLKGQSKIALLGFILGMFTLVTGLVKSGTLFGIALLDNQESPFLGFLAKFVIVPDDSTFIFNAFNVALMIGIVQILTGIIVSMYNKIRFEGSLTAISSLGKLLIVISVIWIFLVEMQKVTALDHYGDLKVYLLVAGILLVAFFHEMNIPIGKRAASSIMPLFFIFTGILGDTLSYVRLFALGLASSVLGLVVNRIGGQIMDGGGFAIVAGVIFLILGHALNLGIAALGSFVHPLRLTFVEFYGNVNFTGKGVRYKPFRKSIKH